MDDNNYPYDEKEDNRKNDSSFTYEDDEVDTFSNEVWGDEDEETEDGYASDEINNEDDSEVENEEESSTPQPTSTNIINKFKGLFNKGGGGAGKVAGAASKASGAVSGISALLANPYFWIIVGGILLVALIIVVIMLAVTAGISAAQHENIDVANGKFDTAFGIRGDKFYGMRVIFEDPEQSIIDLTEQYQNLSINFINLIAESKSLTIKLDLSSTEENTPEEITAMVQIIAEITNGDYTGLDLNNSISNVNHFGFTEEELTAVKESISSYIKDNQSSIFDDSSLSTNELETLFNTKYSTLNVTTPLYYVKDVYLENEESTVAGLTAKNYVAAFFMPKTNVLFKETSFWFLVPDKTTSIDIFYNKIENSTLTTSEVGTTNSTWWDLEENKENQTLEIEDIDLNLSNFEFIDINNLEYLDNLNLYTLLLQDDFTISLETYSKYFDPTKISQEDCYIPTLNNNCVFITFDGNGVFQFCEAVTDYE